MKTKFLFFFGCLLSIIAFGQLDTYDHKIELSGIEDQWHSIELPNSVFEGVSQNRNDLRVYGVTATDTLEAPYILKVSHGDYSTVAVDFNLLNKASNTKGHYFTYEVPTKAAINLIRLDFKNKNFDWKVVLEGSQNQNEWFTILDDYRILSIQNEQTNYTYSNLEFTDAKYRYYRVLIKTQDKPEFVSAKLSVDSKAKDKFQNYAVRNIDTEEKGKQTVLDIDFKRRIPLSVLKINISDDLDYFRPFTIEYLTDSVQTEKGWRYNYRNISSGTLTGIKKNEFIFPTTLAQKFRITIQNNDNQPLTVTGASAKGYVHELFTRFTKPAIYYLAYGKARDRKPQYDIEQANTKIPAELSVLTLGEVQDIPKKGIPTVAPLFENEMWLWGVMGLVIVVLGGFTLKMMQKN